MEKTTPQRRFLISWLVGASLCASCGFTWVKAQRPLPLDVGGCGPTSLYVLCQRLAVETTPDKVFALFGGDVTMTSFAEMERPAHALGLKAQGFQMSIDELRRSRPLGVLHLDGVHFVALIEHQADGVKVAEPLGKGDVRFEMWSYDSLAARWDGRILVVSRRETQ